MLSKREEKLKQEYINLKKFDEEFGVENLCGLDEAGRGPMMGPVVAAAVILGEEPIIGVRDSKKISEKKRYILAETIKEKSKAWAIGYATSAEVDEFGIQKANYMAFERAYSKLKDDGVVINYSLIDGNYKNIDIENHETVVKGDAKSACIAAASILAKTARDSYIVDVCHKEYPEYNFEKNKGYGTKEHLEKIKELGLTPYHRKSFCGKYI
jgi:ribonuclease HII